MTNNVLDIRGPVMQSNKNEVNFDLPNCVQLKTEQDQYEFKIFISKIVKAANDNALEQLSQYVQEQNAAMTALVKKLGA